MYSDLEEFLDKNNIIYEKKYYEENNYTRYFLDKYENKGRYYSIIINEAFTTFEYDSVKYNYVATIIFEEWKSWKELNKIELFDLIKKHMSNYVQSDNESEDYDDDEK